MLVVDSSASMAEDDAPGPRIDAARRAASALMDALPEGTEMGLVTYGANSDDRPESQERSCDDITVPRAVSPVGADDETGGSGRDAIDGLSPGGFTPIGRALRVAADELVGTVAAAGDAEAGERSEKAIVLISDGEDTCGDPTPCEAAQSIAQTHPEITISTIGFKSDVEELACVARQSGGLYLTADNVDQLVTRVLAAQNAPAGARALTATGRNNVELGQHFDDIREANPDFPGQGDGVAEGQLTVIRWVDCDWVFDTGGHLVEIRDPAGSTIDGLTVGDPVERARSLYGEPLDTTSGVEAESVELFPASREAGTAWKIAYGPDETIRSIVLCACLPGSGTTSARWAALPDGAPEWAKWSGVPEVEVLRPVSSDGVVQSGWEVGERITTFRCEVGTIGPRPSYSAIEVGTTECSTTTAHAARDCWPDETGGNALCLRDPFARTLVSIASPRPLTGQPPVDEPGVLAVELANGQQCTYMGGGAGSFVEQGGEFFNTRFGCEDGAIYSSNDGPGVITSGPLRVVPGGFSYDGSGLTAKYSTDWRTLSDVEVTKLYFLGTA